MPTRFLSDAEVERLGGWPEAIERRDVVRFFAPAGEDLAFVREQRGAANQHAVAVQLGALRWLGFVPEDLGAAPPDALTALAETLDVSPRAIFDYASASSMCSATGSSMPRSSDDLIDRWGIGGIDETFVPWRSAGVVAGHRCR